MQKPGHFILQDWIKLMHYREVSLALFTETATAIFIIRKNFIEMLFSSLVVNAKNRCCLVKRILSFHPNSIKGPAMTRSTNILLKATNSYPGNFDLTVFTIRSNVPRRAPMHLGTNCKALFRTPSITPPANSIFFKYVVYYFLVNKFIRRRRQ